MEWHLAGMACFAFGQPYTEKVSPQGLEEREYINHEAQPFSKRARVRRDALHHPTRVEIGHRYLLVSLKYDKEVLPSHDSLCLPPPNVSHI